MKNTSWSTWPRQRAGLLALAVSALMVACGSAPQDEFANISPDKLYADAKEEADDGNFESAIKRLEKVEARASGTVLAQQAQIDLAYAYYKTGEKAQALAKLERFIRLHPTSPALDYAYYLQGLINFNDDLGLFGRLASQDLAERDQQAARDAYESFRLLSDRFPNSKYTPDARLRMNHIVNSLAAGEVHVARYYLRRGANLAAANRAQQAVKDYRQSPAIEEALYIMTKAYDNLGLVQLRDDAQRVLQQSFPGSKYLGEQAQTQQAPVSKPWWQLW
ncbi:outer membrane protein assembly factor BamD [Aquabacterium sp.]|uniref:outer membrane protein assembly factor BamD n=1 Tax=Aquabacterium sp. TaxID=1872578 RepID=UPI0025BF2ED0|nr:outer membrane protein assembly factor BamD [Aquabacterium sp.]